MYETTIYIQLNYYKSHKFIPTHNELLLLSIKNIVLKRQKISVSIADYSYLLKLPHLIF